MYARVPVHIATSYKHTLIQKLSKPRRTAIKGGMGGVLVDIKAGYE